MRTKCSEDVFLQRKYEVKYRCQISLRKTLLNLSELIGLLSISPQLSNNLYPALITKTFLRKPKVLG